VLLTLPAGFQSVMSAALVSDSLEDLERALSWDVHGGAIAETTEDLNQTLRVLVGARARSGGGVEMVPVQVRRRNAWVATGRPEHQMDNVRRDANVSHERRVELERKVGPRDRRMDGEHVRSRPRTRRLRLDGCAVDGEGQADDGSEGHSRDGNARTCR
jgi:hypothetical protein